MKHKSIPDPTANPPGSVGPRAAARRALSASLLALTGLLIAFLGWSCGSGGLSVFQSAPPLPEFDTSGTYSPYFASGPLNIPRYFHEAIPLRNGLVLAVGGSDERGFSSLDSAEIFDQAALKKDEKEPESIKGTWFDTDFEGNAILMSTGRIYFSLTEIPGTTDTRVIVIGGTGNLNRAQEVPAVEVFDPVTRKFERIDTDVVEPRFRHAAVPLNDGRILITGGQIHSTFTETLSAQVTGSGASGSGNVTIGQQFDIFPSIKRNEVFIVKDQTFLPLTLPGTDREVFLTTPRGRAGHEVGRFAGPDNRLNTGDDLTLLVGGFQTLSGENAPRAKFPGTGGKDALLELEFFDPLTGVFTKIPALRMLGPRISEPQVTNLGIFNEFTPDGVLGMGNVMLVCGGDNDGPIGARTSTSEDEVLIATFTGFGPAQGLQVFRQDSAQGGHIQGIEAFFALQGAFEQPVPPGRSDATIVPLKRRLQGIQGVRGEQTWVFFGAGVHYWVIPPQVIYFGGTIQAGAIFDPLYSLEAVIDFQTSARDLRPGRTSGRNPQGVIGTWLGVDGRFPEDSLVGFGDTPFGSWPAVPTNRVWLVSVSVPGEDGIIGTFDDRVLLTGGGQDPAGNGGETSSPPSVLWVPPNR